MDGHYTTAVADHIAAASDSPIAPDIADRAKQHLLDSLIAMLSGATLHPGRLAIRYAYSRGGAGESTIINGHRTNPETAAFTNAVCAHANETDDVNNRARIHPGSSIVPSAISMGEALDSSGRALLQAVCLGYDVAGAVNIGAWRSIKDMDRSPRTSHGLGQTFGAAAAASSLAKLTTEQNLHVLSYAAQQVAGIATIYRDPEHIGKAFATAAVQAHAGVRAVELVRFGFTGVRDVFDGSPSVFDAFGREGSNERMLRDLINTRHVTQTDIKQYPVGGPIQPAAQAVEHLIQTHGLQAEVVESIAVHMPTAFAYVVNDRPMPDINLQYIVSVLLIDGEITFQNSHDYDRFNSREIREFMDRVRLVADPSLDVTDEFVADNGRTWRAAVVVEMKDGRTLREQVDACWGTHKKPMTWHRLTGKAHMALRGTMVDEQIDALIEWVQSVESAESTREVRRFLSAAGGR
ncbi:MmgE/PrpD family protein [Paenarthrobacter ureafaciens]|uniref:MmgE/PrpD family protein n=1 Tax=Paenarthrobacter ureafaciens TaxID=37931 RepID=UPI002DB58FF2|nr:MmgE/PrpD family protein [Paenarthrobacter ureafaciens]MEC3853126.1 MmgE/PrpD family protein [Paenarthrobacter ureafaciens]